MLAVTRDNSQMTATFSSPVPKTSKFACTTPLTHTIGDITRLLPIRTDNGPLPTLHSVLIINTSHTVRYEVQYALHLRIPGRTESHGCSTSRTYTQELVCGAIVPGTAALGYVVLSVQQGTTVDQYPDLVHTFLR